MSGTSLDGIDVGLVKIDQDHISLLAFECYPYDSSLKLAISEFSKPGNPVLISDFGSLDTALAHLFAEASLDLLEKAGVSGDEIIAIGSHGHTIFHAPFEDQAFCLQIADPNVIAEKTGITTIADFRRRDIAAGGQGAPLVPAFHCYVFSRIFDLNSQAISIINIGGIANVTHLSPQKVQGFDIGPGNCLMDLWIKKHKQQDFDENGVWAESGQVNTTLLSRLKEDAYFAKAAPKSTGREYFSAQWLTQYLLPFSSLAAQDVQATLCQLVADTICDTIRNFALQSEQILICGGGAHNLSLMHRLQHGMDKPVRSTADYGVDPDHVEAMAFAWLARQTLNNQPGNLTQVTGANRPLILGGIYPGKNGLSCPDVN